MDDADLPTAPSLPTLGGVPITVPSAQDMRLAMLIWGDAGCGKTTLAATAPGTKLFLMFDPDGALSLAGRDDVQVLDLSDRNYVTVMAEFRKDDPFTLGRHLSANPVVDTVVVDSMTTLAYMALLEAVSRNKSSSIEQPGMHGYTWRNATVLRAATSIMQITKRLDRNVVFITHEASAERDAEGRPTSVTMALSEGVANQVGLRLNEVWWMRDHESKRSIAVRPCRMRRPMKSRLFDAKVPEFDWHYDPDTHVGEGIADWFEAWQRNGGKRLPLPVSKLATIGKTGGVARKK